MTGYNPENWGTIGPEVEGLRARIEKLERRMNRFELVHEQHVAQAIESRNQRDERIEALEAHHNSAVDDINNNDRRALSRIAGLEAALVDNGIYADRAHGPLEAKAIDVDKRLTELQDEAVFKRSEVEALVKAARELVENIEPYTAAWHLTNIKSALKPFETVKP